jgi:hypothetical protein
MGFVTIASDARGRHREFVSKDLALAFIASMK